MARVCEICGKGRSIGNSIETRGKAKYLGGVGTKITGITRRAFLPNLQSVRTTTSNGTTKTVRVCTQCVRSGAVRKQVRNAPFRVGLEEPQAPGKPVANRRADNRRQTETKKATTKKRGAG